MIRRRKPAQESAFTHLVPVALTATDVRVLPFAARSRDGDTVRGVARLPDGTHAEVIVPAHHIRRK